MLLLWRYTCLFLTWDQYSDGAIRGGGEDWSIVVLLGLVGLMVGSFLNVVIVRLPVMLQRRYEYECRCVLDLPHEDKPERYDLLLPGSHCPHCRSPIPWRYNVPVIGYLVLGGKSACCGQPIGMRYPCVEVLAALLIIAPCLCGLTGESLLAAVLLGWLLLVACFIDLEHMLLPDELTLPLLWSGLWINRVDGFVSAASAIEGAILGYVLLWACNALYRGLRGVDGMGRGDFKLLAGLGAWMGVEAVGPILFWAALLGTLLGIAAMMQGRMTLRSAMPFGPALAIAGLLYFFADRCQLLG